MRWPYPTAPKATAPPTTVRRLRSVDMFSPSHDLLVRLHLRCAVRRLRQRADDGASRQIDLEVVVREAPGVAQQDVGRTTEIRSTRRLPAQARLSLRIAPRLVGNPAQRETPLPDRAAIEDEPDRDRYQREGVGQTVADLDVRVVRGEALGRQIGRASCRERV